MKKNFLLISIFILSGILFIRGRNLYQNDQEPVFQYPPDVKAVIDQKCYGCHSFKSESDDAKEALMWDSIPDFSKARQVSKLDDIIEVLHEGSMPPKEVLEEYPDAALLPVQRQILISWAEGTADDLLK